MSVKIYSKGDKNTDNLILKLESYGDNEAILSSVDIHGQNLKSLMHISKKGFWMCGFASGANIATSDDKDGRVTIVKDYGDLE